jgi:hypothetical protein
VRKGTPCGRSACIRVPFPVEPVPRVPQHPPDEMPDEGATTGDITRRPPSRASERAGRQLLRSCPGRFARALPPSVSTTATAEVSGRALTCSPCSSPSSAAAASTSVVQTPAIRGSSSAAAPTPHADASVETHGRQQRACRYRVSRARAARDLPVRAGHRRWVAWKEAVGYRRRTRKWRPPSLGVWTDARARCPVRGQRFRAL